MGLIVIKAFSQTAFGIKAGINYATIENYFSYAGNTSKYKIGLNAGFFSNIKLSKHFAVQPELFYSQKGARYTTSVGERTMSLNYVSVPLLAGYSPGEGFMLLAGPELNFRFGTPTIFQKFDLTVNVGAAYKVKRLGFDIRYDHGFNNLMNGYQLDENGFPTSQKKTYGSNSVFLLSVTYILFRK